jgi:hypothetical protein
MRRRELLAILALAGSPALAHAGEGGEKKKKGAGTTYIAIETLTGATNKPAGRRGVLTVECGLDVPDQALRARAELMLPRLRAAYLQTVLTYAAGLPPATAPSVDYLALSLQRTTDQLLGRPGAKLLLGAVLVN